MGNCNCKVNKQIDYLHKKYGHEIPVSKKTTISFNIKEWFRNLLISVVTLLLSPILLLHVLYVSIFKKDKSVSIRKLMSLTKANK